MSAPAPSAELLAKAAKVRMFVTDVDGVWTDGFVTVHADGTESVRFSIQDGYGIVALQKAGVEFVIISGRLNPAVEHRARRLGVETVHLGVKEKGGLLDELIAARGLAPEEVAAIGDDLPDLPLFERAGVRLAPPGAVAEVRARADWTTAARAGDGCLREACDLLLAARAAASAR